VTEKGLFFPEWHEEIVEVRKLVRVEPHEVAVVRDNDGRFHFHDGSKTVAAADGGVEGGGGGGGGTAFFLPPHCELVTMYWGSGTSKEDVANNIVNNAKEVRYKVPVQKIDMRAAYAQFEYKVRTSDNVELLLEGQLFWQVVDVPTMIERTGDPKSDVWYHARASLIQEVSKVTLQEFMASVNEIVARAGAGDPEFYARRGVALHALEVVRYECADASTAGVLQEIIQETTNRINRLQQQQSENEVQRERMTAEIEIERQRRELVEQRTANALLEASSAGEADGTRLAQNSRAFLELLAHGGDADGMGDGAVPDEKTRLDLLRFFSEQRTLTAQTEHLSQGSATLFLTPEDVNLRLQMPGGAAGGAAATAGRA